VKHIVFILGSYYPNFSAVGACARNVIRELVRDYRITVLSLRDDMGQPSRERVDGVDIVRVDTPQRRQRLMLMAAATSMGLYGTLRLQSYRIFIAANKLLGRETVESDLVAAYLRELEAFHDEVHVLVPLVFPFESVLAALAHKKLNPTVLVIPYLFDDFVESRSLHLLAMNRMLKERRHVALERTMLDEAYAVLAMHPLRTHFARHFKPAVVEKIRFLEHPLLTPHAVATAQQTIRPVVLSYAGSLIRKVREPDYLLEMLQAMPVDCPVRVDFYVMGNDAHKVKDQVVSDQLHITNRGRVSEEGARFAMTQSNILLNLGEVRGKQVSSKVFEYMAAGKPIIHLAFVANDAVAAVLAKYPLSLCLIQTRSQLYENACHCAEFIHRHKHSQLAFAEVAALYPEAIPGATADLIRSLLNPGMP